MYITKSTLDQLGLLLSAPKNRSVKTYHQVSAKMQNIYLNQIGFQANLDASTSSANFVLPNPTGKVESIGIVKCVLTRYQISFTSLAKSCFFSYLNRPV